MPICWIYIPSYSAVCPCIINKILSYSDLPAYLSEYTASQLEDRKLNDKKENMKNIKILILAIILTLSTAMPVTAAASETVGETINNTGSTSNADNSIKPTVTTDTNTPDTNKPVTANTTTNLHEKTPSTDYHRGNSDNQLQPAIPTEKPDKSANNNKNVNNNLPITRTNPRITPPANLPDNNQQSNNANISNDINQSAITGKNNASMNTGTDVNVNTGDANVSGTIINGVNTNLNNIGASEVNVTGSQTGNMTLNFSPDCSSNCISPSSSQKNTAKIGDNLTLTADSGHNSANANTGGNVSVTTGDANVSAGALSFVNNNLQGQVIYKNVNIYGNLTGDIIAPMGTTNDATAAGSVTSISASSQTNSAQIDNSVTITSNTGKNTVDFNTGGSSTVTTGGSDVKTQAVNVANSVVNGGKTLWVVVVNQVGRWVGKIIGTSDGTNIASSTGTAVSTDQNNSVTVTNSQNQTTNITSSDSSSNQATVKNNLNLTANTGSNKANMNTGGNVAIRTGSTRVIASLVNFVNNSVSSGSKIIVVVVNVFGSWVGNFIPA